jgi:hypothetical protein
VKFEDFSANDNAVVGEYALAADRRRNVRQRVLLGGKLAYLANNFTADCTVRNLSSDGALVITAAMPLPHDPFLIVTSRATAHRARTAWRDGERSGIAFETTWRLDAGTPLAPTGLRDLWLELVPRRP